MGIIAFIILGLLAGIIAKAILPGDDPGGFIVTAIIGIVGALLGGLLASAHLRRSSVRRVLRHLDLDHRDRRLDHPPADLPARRQPRRRPHASHLVMLATAQASRDSTPRPAPVDDPQAGA